MMVLAAPLHLKNKVNSRPSFRESNRLNLWMDFEDRSRSWTAWDCLPLSALKRVRNVARNEKPAFG